MNVSDFLPTSWVEAHAAVTHFPIALLLVAVFFQFGALVLRNGLWRDIAFAVLTLTVISMPFGLVSGYFTGAQMPRPPAQFDLHWKAAVATALLSAVWWVWEWKIRPKRIAESRTVLKSSELDTSRTGEIETRREVFPPRRQSLASQWAMLGLAGISAMGVGFTGHLGGEMTFGGRGDDEPVAVATPATEDPNKLEKIALAAGKMENAAGKLDVATDRMALATQSQKPAPPAPVPPAPVVNVAPGEIKVDASALDRAAANMERVASRFETTAKKMETIAAQIGQNSSAPATANAPKTAATTSSPAAPGGKTVVVGAKTPATAPSAAPPKPEFDPQLVALGAQKYQDEELGCTGCHKLAGKGGRSGPDLTFAGRLHGDVEWQIAHLKDPKSKIPGSSMPAYNDLPEGDLRALATYMASLK